MRELIVDVESSTAESLFLRDQDGHEYRLPVTDELRALITRDGGAVESTRPDAGSAQDSPAAGDRAEDPADGGVTLTPVSALTPVPDITEQPERPDSDDRKKDKPASAGAPAGPRARRDAAADAEERERSLPKPDPLLSNPLTMRPRDIQERIRAGASTQELADEMQVAYSRVEPYAHPVMLERERMAAIAKQSHPVREDGPAKLTLWEVLAAAFGARGHSLADATWDAYKESGNAWVVRLSWRAGLSENQAEWVLRNHHSSSPTTEARDATAADLTDPDFIQPVRSLSPISRGERITGSSRADAGDFDDADADADSIRRQDEAGDEAGAGAGPAELEAVPDSPEPETDLEDEHASGAESAAGADPDAQPKPAKRRRKAVTPHWEDVLLGVRSNTKRPRS